MGLALHSRMRSKLTSRIEEAMARLEGSDPNSTKSTLLIVDDEKGPRESLRMILSPHHRVLLAEDARQALEILRSTPVDVATLDLNMPGMKGDELMRTIRKEFPQVETIIITGCSSVETAVDGIRHGVFDYLTKPFDVVEVSTTVRRALARRESRLRLIAFLGGIGRVLGKDRDPESALDELDSSQNLQEHLRAALQNPVLSPASECEELTAERANLFLEALAEAIETRESHKCGHARRVAFLTGLMTERMGLPAEQREEIRVVSLLHDLGRVGIVPCAERRDQQPLYEEREGNELHAVMGAQLVEPLGFPAEVANGIRHHHEHWNGAGYPDGLKEEAIPLASRIVAIADSFDDLTSDHPYRPALSHGEAVAELREQAGSRVDPNLLKEFIAIAEIGLCGTGPLAGLRFAAGEDPVDTIASATAWIETDR